MDLPSPPLDDVYSRYPHLHPSVPLGAALMLFEDEYRPEHRPCIRRACERAGLHTFGDLLRQDLSRFRLRPRCKKQLRLALCHWKQRQMRFPTKAEVSALFRMAKSPGKAEAELAADESKLKGLLSWTSVTTRGATVIDLLSVSDAGFRFFGQRGEEALGISLLKTAIRCGNHAMVRMLSDHVVFDDLLAGEEMQAGGLPLVSAGPLLDAFRETAHAPATLLAHAVRYWTMSAVEALLGDGQHAHYSMLIIAIRRDRDGLIDLFLPGGQRTPVVTPPLPFAVVKAALDARRADLVLRLLRAGAPAHGVQSDHRIVDRLVSLWHGWLVAADVDVSVRMREGRALAVHNNCLPPTSKLPTHRAGALRLEPVHEVLWERYTAADAHSAHAYCSLAMVRAVAPWVGTDWTDGGSMELHRLYPRAAFDARLRALLLVAMRCPGVSDSLWVCLVGREMAAQGQPPNLSAMQRRAGEEEREAEHRRNLMMVTQQLAELGHVT